MQPRTVRTLLLAATASLCVGVAVCLLNASDAWLQQSGPGDEAGPWSRRLLQAVPAAVKEHLQAGGTLKRTYKLGKWGPRHVVALVLSILVSLTSSVDRECGSSLYMVLFAVLLNMPFRQAAATTAFTVALGALGPGIASMSEAHITERGILAIVDYGGALVLLPTMFWGISFGVIVNLIFPNWALALLWVVVVLGSNLELIVSLTRYLKIQREASTVGEQLAVLQEGVAATNGALELSTAAVTLGNGSAATSRPAAAAAAAAADGTPPPPPPPAAAAVAIPLQQQEADLMDRANVLRHKACQIEALALLYPVLYTPTVERVLKERHLGHGLHPTRITATPSTLTNMDRDHLVLEAQLPAFQTVFGRFTLAWKRWNHLNNHFELALVLKVVVLHLVTEAIRHHTSKPCSLRFWIQVFGLTGLVTGFLVFTVICYSTKRLWRGPHWVGALDTVRQLKRQQQQEELAQLTKDSDAMPASASGTSAAGQLGTAAGTAAAAAPALRGEAVAVTVGLSQQQASRSSPSPAAGAAAAAGDNLPVAAATAAAEEEGAAPRLTCCGRFRKRAPWFWGPADAAVTNISDCNSYNQYRNWRVPLILLCAAATLPIGILGCALGLPGGPLMSHMLLALGLKPRVVAGTSRFLVLCFTFGSFVVHIIAGNLEPTLAAAFGLLNLGLAPLGMVLFTKHKPRGVRVIIMSLVMGLTGLVVITLGQLVPLMADLAGRKGVAVGSLGALPRDVATSLHDFGNTFQMARWCYSGKHH